jgi:threonine dehydratase
VTAADIRAAHARIAAHIRRTPIIETPAPIAGMAPVSLKLECLQHAGSFKARGAFHNLLSRPAPAAGCATASGGNHRAAVAYAAEKLGVRARVFVPEIATPAKIAKIRAHGAEAVVSGGSYAEAQARCDAYVAESGALKIHPYDAAETIAGAGTAALEWEEGLARLALPALDTVLVAVGGGG